MGTWLEPRPGRITIHIRKLNDTDPVRYLERSESQRSGGAVCECRGR